MWWANAIMMGAATITSSLCSVCSCVLDEPVILQRTVLTYSYFVFLLRDHKAYANNPRYRLPLSTKNLQSSDPNLESRVHLFYVLTGFRRRLCGFSVWAFLVDVVDFVIVLFQSGVFEYVFFCVRVVVLVYVLGFVIVLFQSGVFEHLLFRLCKVVATRICFG